MSPESLPQSIDTVIIGNGPAALILSYILHGNCPFYDTSFNRHPDNILDSELKDGLLHIINDFGDITAHFPSSRFSYSTAALPINVLLDTLLRPLADTEPGRYRSCVKWKRLPEKAVPHLLLGATTPGGQWASNPVRASWKIGSLSYLDQLSLPEYSLRDHLKSQYDADEMDFIRPTRAEIADYLAAYPAAVGIQDSIYPPSVVLDVRRTKDGFYIGSHSISCKHLVLASGIFTNLLPARPQLRSLLGLTESGAPEPPLLVVGSGFSAADVIITNLPKRKIIHIFKWDPDNRPSPLRACHRQAYPEYAGVYKQMKLAATAMVEEGEGTPALARRKSNTLRHMRADLNYEGFPNTFIAEASVENNIGAVKLRLPSGEVRERRVSNLAYVIGRRGSLSYLDPDLLEEAAGQPLSMDQSGRISGKTLRSKVEEELEVAPDVFVVGSLTGDSLIRHAYGSCVYAAQKIMSAYDKEAQVTSRPKGVKLQGSCTANGIAHAPATWKPTHTSSMLESNVEMEEAEPCSRRKRERWRAGSCIIC